MAEPPPPEMTPEQAAATARSKRYLVLLIIAAVIGVIVSAASWGFLELTYQIQQELFTHLPHAFGYHNGPPLWWSLPVLAVAGVIVGAAIRWLPGTGGHLPARGLATGDPTRPIDLPGVMAAGLVSIGFGVVIGPEAPLLALGTGLAVFTIGLARREAPPQVVMILSAAGAFAAISFVFTSPLIAAVILIEATGLGGARRTLVILPGLLAAGIGTLIAIGLGSWSGLSTSSFALTPFSVPSFGHPDIAQFGWTIALALLVAIVGQAMMRGGMLTYRFAGPRPIVVLPIVGLAIAGLAIAFNQATGHSVNEVLFSGQAALPGLISKAGTWSVGALLMLLLCKGLGYSLSLGSFRGGPTFPAVFLGAAAGVAFSHLPGFPLSPAASVGMGAGVATILRLPLSAVVLATLLTVKAGTGEEPLIIVGVVVAYLATLAISAWWSPTPAPAQGEGAGERAPAGVGAPAPAAAAKGSP
jgi:H+/Cl- antiporter ClcA